MTHPIYTWGYSGHTPDELDKYLQAAGAQLLDIRLRPYSRQVGWGSDALKRRFGRLYRHLGSLGNRNYQGGPILLDAPDVAVPIVRQILATRPVILLCVCWDVETCHRKVAAEYLGNILGADVQHLPGRFREWQGQTTDPDPADRIRGLSLWQPWASLIGAGKWIETRSWGTDYRGPVLIQAAKRFGQDERWQSTQEPFNTALYHAGYRKLGDLPLGAFVGVADLIACERMTEAAIPERLAQQCATKQPGWNAEWERAFGNYASGRYAWLFANVRRLATPIPARGFQGLWTCDLPDAVAA